MYLVCAAGEWIEVEQQLGWLSCLAEPRLQRSDLVEVCQQGD